MQVWAAAHREGRKGARSHRGAWRAAGMAAPRAELGGSLARLRSRKTAVAARGAGAGPRGPSAPRTGLVISLVWGRPRGPAEPPASLPLEERTRPCLSRAHYVLSCPVRGEGARGARVLSRRGLSEGPWQGCESDGRAEEHSQPALSHVAHAASTVSARVRGPGVPERARVCLGCAWLWGEEACGTGHAAI